MNRRPADYEFEIAAAGGPDPLVSGFSLSAAFDQCDGESACRGWRTGRLLPHEVSELRSASSSVGAAMLLDQLRPAASPLRHARGTQVGPDDDMKDERVDTCRSNGAGETVWLTLRQAAARAVVSEGTLKREVHRRRIRFARVGGRRCLRFRPEWIDAWLEGSATPVEVQLQSEPAIGRSHRWGQGRAKKVG